MPLKPIVCVSYEIRTLTVGSSYLSFTLTELPKPKYIKDIKNFDTAFTVVAFNQGNPDSLVLDSGYELYEWSHQYGKGVDIIVAGQDKGNAIKKILSNQSGKSFAFGNGKNDIPMFKIVEIAIAMGNSDKSLFEFSDYIIGNDTTDTIYKFLNENKHIKKNI